MAQAYLGDFCARVDPNYQSAKHTRALCDALEAIERRDIHRLAVFMPPRFGKSLHISINFPAWYLGRNPNHQLILASYGAELAESNSRKVRNLLGSQRYPFSVRVASDSAAANRWATNRGGIVVAAGVGGSLTGFGANCVTGDTVIETDVGPIAIERLVDMQDKPRVLSFNHSHESPSWQRVVATRRSSVNGLVEITTVGGRRVAATSDHRFYDAVRGQYVSAVDLAPGDNLYASHQRKIESDSVATSRRITGSAVVYDIQVEHTENFFANGVLVHNCLLADDLLRSREDADSEVYREKTWGWWTDVAQTRLMPGGTIVLGGTRWHEDDVYARVLNSQGGNEWHVINMPAIDEFGNALWPEWFDLDALNRIRAPMPPRSWAALYMQNPQAEEGGMFKRSTFGIRWKDPLPKMNFTVLTIDSAFKTGIMNDYSALALWGMSNQKYFLIHAVHGRWEFPDLIRKITALNSEYHPNVILIEDAASGQSAIQQLKLTRMPIVPYKERGSKESRAEAVTGIFESGRVVLPESAVWLDEWMDEHAGFPTSKHDDFVDTTSMALGYLSKKSGFGGRKLQPLDMRVRMGTRRR